MTVQLHGHSFDFDNLADFEKQGPGRYTVRHVARQMKYCIHGGKALGKASRDWSVRGHGWPQSLPCTSLVDGLRLLDKMT